MFERNKRVIVEWLIMSETHDFSDQDTKKIIEDLEDRAEDIRKVEEMSTGGTLVSTNTKVMVAKIEELASRKEDL